MNRINPLYVGLLLVMLLLVLYVKLSGLKTELKEAKNSYKESELLAKNLSALKNVYANKSKSKASLLRILSQSSIKSANIQKKETKKGMKLSASKMDAKVLNSLMSKVLNGSYQITSLKIKRLSTTQVSFEMEIKW